MLRKIIKAGLVSLCIGIVCAFVPLSVLGYGLDWPRLWFALGLVFGMQLAVNLWLLCSDPELLRERISPSHPKDPQDRWASYLIIAMFCVWLMLAAISSVALPYVWALPMGLSVFAGIVLYCAGMGLIVQVFKTNRFAGPTSNIQLEREHVLVTGGPYGYVRHPMYSAMIVLYVGLGLIIGSTVMALLAVPMICFGFLPRMLAEERVLSVHLQGYDAYAQRVRCRLIPGLF